MFYLYNVHLGILEGDPGGVPLALQVERWMRNRLESVSVQKALASLQRIKMGELQVNGKTVKMATRPTEEQKELLAKLGAKPIPRKITDHGFCSVKTAPS